MARSARWKCRTQKNCQNIPSEHHRTTLLGYVFATKVHVDNRKKNLLSGNISSTCSHNMVNFSLLTAEIVSLVSGTPANFNGFRVLASLLSDVAQRKPTKLFSVWPLPGPVDYIHFRRLLLRTGILPGAKFTWRSPSLLLLIALPR